MVNDLFSLRWSNAPSTAGGAGPSAIGAVVMDDNMDPFTSLTKNVQALTEKMALMAQENMTLMAALTAGGGGSPGGKKRGRGPGSKGGDGDRTWYEHKKGGNDDAPACSNKKHEEDPENSTCWKSHKQWK